MRISVRVKPNSKEERIEKIGEDSFLVCVKERPQDGKANKAVAELLADYFSIPKSAVILKLGQTSRQKVFEVRESN